MPSPKATNHRDHASPTPAAPCSESSWPPLAGLLIAGTVVTGAGPHGGDPDVERFDAPIETLTRIHAAFLYLFLAVLVVLGVQWYRARVEKKLWLHYTTVWVIALAQGVLGVVQYRLGIPEALVSLHVLGSMLIIVATAACGVPLGTGVRSSAPVPAPERHTVGAA